EKGRLDVCLRGATHAGGRNTPPQHRPLPDEQPAVTHKFSIAGHLGFLTVGMYDDRTPGEIQITMAKVGSVINGLMSCWAGAVTLGLQHGVPLERFLEQMLHTQSEPTGFTSNQEIPIARSIMGYMSRWMASKFTKPSQ